MNLLKGPYKMFITFSKLHSRKNLYRLLVSAIQQQCRPDQTIINVGAGGEIRRILVEQHLRFREIDIDEKRKPDVVCSLEDMRIFEDNTVDVFFCMEVLEHVERPFDAIQEIRRVLKPGGILIGSTPFVFPIHDEPYDFFRYTKYGLRSVFKEFDVLQLVERNSYIESMYVIFLRLLNVGSARQRLVGIFLTPLYLLLLPFVLLLSPLVTNKNATTGYFFIFKKRT